MPIAAAWSAESKIPNAVERTRSWETAGTTVFLVMIWSGGRTATIELNRGRFEVYGRNYKLESTEPISFAWGPEPHAVVQTLGSAVDGGGLGRSQRVAVVYEKTRNILTAPGSTASIAISTFDGPNVGAEV